MISKSRASWIVLTLLVAIVPMVARAGLGHRRLGTCGRCAHSFSQCGCARPFCSACQMAPSSCTCQMPVVQTQIVPQTTTILRQEQFTVMQPVTRTEIQRQTQIVDVPVTTCRQVTVDEGAYQTVWVPKLTTRTVSETAIQKQVRYQDVPVQVVQQVPVVQTRVVPQQVTTYAQRSYVVSAPAQHQHLHHHHAAVPSTIVGTIAPSISFEPIPHATAASIAQTPGPNSVMASVPSASVNPTESHAADGGSWSKVPRRDEPASPVQLQSYEREVRAVPRPAVPAGFPSAAAVWQAQGAFSRN